MKTDGKDEIKEQNEGNERKTERKYKAKEDRERGKEIDTKRE
jgi:hypothetical protein